MSMVASQITGVSTVYIIVCSGADQRKYQSSTPLVFVRVIHQWPMNSPHKGPVNASIWWRHHEVSNPKNRFFGTPARIHCNCCHKYKPPHQNVNEVLSNSTWSDEPQVFRTYCSLVQPTVYGTWSCHSLCGSHHEDMNDYWQIIVGLRAWISMCVANLIINHPVLFE